jgi:hypothetical protein
MQNNALSVEVRPRGGIEDDGGYRGGICVTTAIDAGGNYQGVDCSIAQYLVWLVGIYIKEGMVWIL